MDWRPYLVIDPAIRSGKPCIVGTRITVGDVLDLLASDMTETEILNDYPALTREHLRAVMAFIAEREHRVVDLMRA